MGKSIIYVNYSPYENAGHILDYLLENFDRVFLFSIAFHTLGGRKQLNKLTIYESGRRILVEELFYMNIPQSLVLFLIPVRSIMNAIQIISRTIKLKLKYGKIDIFFSVNAFTAVIGMFLRKIEIVGKNIYWVWDYYPIDHPNIFIRILRWLYWQFDKLATHADVAVYLNNRLAQVRVEAKIIERKSRYHIVPIGVGNERPLRKKYLKNIRIGFLGVLKKSQGLDMLFESASDLAGAFNHISFEIIGSGPDENYFKKLAKKSPVRFNFHGYVSDKECSKILDNLTLGIAPYTPEDYNVSRYGDPAKIKLYVEHNLPSITTDVFEFSKEIQRNKAGVLIDYGNYLQLIKAIDKILVDYNRYVRGSRVIRKKYYYKDIYPEMFA